MTREVLPGVTTVLTMSLTSATVATTEITDILRQHTYANVVPLSVYRHTLPAACAVGAFVGRDGLALTSYRAIRGADSVGAGLPGAPRVTMAAYDVAADIAVLRVAGSAPRTDSIALASAITDGQSLWGVRLADCRTPSDARARVQQWTNRPDGALQLAEAAADATAGTIFVDRLGLIAGLWTNGASAIPAPKLTPLLDQARRATAQPSIADVSRRENHLYGSMAIATDVATATISVSPMETWQWETLATSGPAPLTFSGPMGRYRIVATTPDGARREQLMTIRPDALSRAVVSLRTIAAGTEQRATVAPKRRSKLPWILGGVGGVGLLAAVALGGGGGGGGGGGTTPPGTGSISVQIPVNPP